MAAEAARQDLDVRGTPVQMLAGGAGPELLFLHGAGGAGRWLEFQAQLAQRFHVRFPSHPGHGGSAAAEWIEHISDLAFHYLDLLDALRVERVHLVGASFGGWIAAEIAVMAGHRLASLTLIDRCRATSRSSRPMRRATSSTAARRPCATSSACSPTS